MMLKCYSELLQLTTFKERYEYLRLDGVVGEETFGFDRYLNQIFYNSQEWKDIRRKIIIRDNGCDLGLDGYEIRGKILIHHMNPIRQQDILLRTDLVLNPEYLIATTLSTHNAIHYGDAKLLLTVPNSQLRTPVKASNGILVTRFSDHALDRTQTESRPVTVEGILDALKNPLNHGSIKTKTDKLGRPSQQFIGKSATVTVNPENGTITTTWCTGSRTKRKYLKKG